MDRGTINLISKLPLLHSDNVGLADIIKNVLDEEKVKSGVEVAQKDGVSVKCGTRWRRNSETPGSTGAGGVWCQPSLTTSSAPPCTATSFTQPIPPSSVAQPIASTSGAQVTQGSYKHCSTNVTHKPNMPCPTGFSSLSSHTTCSTDFLTPGTHKTLSTDSPAPHNASSTGFSGAPHNSSFIAIPHNTSSTGLSTTPHNSSFTAIPHNTSSTGLSTTPHNSSSTSFTTTPRKPCSTIAASPSLSQGAAQDRSSDTSRVAPSCSTNLTTTQTSDSKNMKERFHKNASGCSVPVLSFFQPSKYCPSVAPDPSPVPALPQHTDADTDLSCDNVTPIEIGDIGEAECEEITQHLLSVSQAIFSTDDPATQMANWQKQQSSILTTLPRCPESSSPGGEGPKRSSREDVLYASMAYVEMTIIQIVKLAKQIPGFKDLSMDDQASLIRENRTEGFYIWAIKSLVHSSSKSFSTVHGAHITIEQMASVFSRDFIENSFHMNKRITALNLTPAEETLISVISITFTDRSRLSNPVAVQNIQNKLISCLMHVITKSGRYDVGSRLGKLFSLLTDLRNTSEVDFLELKKGLMSSQYQNSAAVQEFL